MRYPDTQSASQRQTPEDESQAPPNVPVSVISLPQPAGVAEQGSAQVKPSWFILDPSPLRRNSTARTSLSGTTAYEEEPKTTSPRLWSCPTWGASFSQASTIYECADSTSIHHHHSEPYLEAVGTWSHSTIVPEAKESHLNSSKKRQDGNWTLEPLSNRFETRLPMLSEFLNKHKFKNTLKDIGAHSSLHQFSHKDSQEMPWTSFNLRVPGSICAFCGSPFTGPDHMKNVTTHILVKHYLPNQYQLPAPHAKQARFYKDFTNSRNATHDGRSTSKTDEFSKITNAQWREVNAMGSWTYRDLLTGRKTSDMPPITTHQHLVIECDNPGIPHNRLLFLLNSLDPSGNPRRANDFFNSLDLIIGNFLDKFPDEIVVLGIQSALARLEHLYGINFGSSTGRLSTRTSIAAAQGVKSCAGSQKKSPPTDSPSKFPHATSRRNGQKRGHTDPSGPAEENLGDSPNETKVKRSRTSEINRVLLACPFQKHCEVYGQILCCRFEGALSMSSVTQHLHTRVHSQAVGFLKLCRKCWQYIMVRREYHNFHGSGQCTARPQPKGSLVAAQWYSLYRLLFPHSERIPSPYVGDTTWERAHTFNLQHSPAEEEEPEFDFNTFPTSRSFLEQPQPAIRNESPQAHNLLAQSQHITILAAEAAAMELFSRMLSEHVWRPYDLSDHYTFSLIESASQLAPEYLEAFSGRIHASLDEMINTIRARAPASLAPSVNPANIELPVSDMQDHQHSNTIFPHDQWIGQFPVPPHLSEVHESNHITPEQPPWSFDTFLQSYEEMETLPGSAGPSYSTFVPDIDHSQMFFGHDLVSRDGSGTHTAISV